MESVALSYGPSRAEISLLGAHVDRLSLAGADVLKPSGDGRPTHGGAAVLIPFAGRVRDGRYSFDGKAFALPVGPSGHASHGFAKDAPWRIVRKGAASATLETTIEGEGYPGVLEVEVTYALSGESFSTECKVANVSPCPCPLVVGFHPYFLAADWRIEADRASRYVLADGFFPTGRTEPYSFENAGHALDFDDVFGLPGKVSLLDPSRTLSILRRRMPYLIVYNGEYAEGRSVALEPYTAVPDAFNNGIGLERLEPGSASSCGYEIRSSGARLETGGRAREVINAGQQ